MESVMYIQSVVNRGARICEELKKIAPDATWQEIGDLFKLYKQNVRKDITDIADLECLDEIWVRIRRNPGMVLGC